MDFNRRSHTILKGHAMLLTPVESDLDTQVHGFSHAVFGQVKKIVNRNLCLKKLLLDMPAKLAFLTSNNGPVVFLDPFPDVED